MSSDSLCVFSSNSLNKHGFPVCTVCGVVSPVKTLKVKRACIKNRSFVISPLRHKNRKQAKSLVSEYPYNKQYKMVYIHAPKTGGTTCKKVFLCCSCYYTKSAKQFVKERPSMRDYYKVGSIRNPYDRFTSYYYGVKKNQQRKSLKSKYGLNVSHDDDFTVNEFVLTLSRGIDLDNKDALFKKFMFPSMCWQYCDDNGTLLIDSVVKLENFETDVREIHKKLGYSDNIEITYNNYNKKRLRHDRLDGEAKEVIYNLYQEDFEQFGYNR